MRIDPDTCRDPDLLAAEVRRLRATLDELRAAADQADAEYQTEIACLRLTDAEREAVEYYVGTGGPDAVDATLRGLLERTRPPHHTPGWGSVPDRGTPAETPPPDPERDIPPAWLARPYWVDPPSGWLYGFPRLYDPAADGDMTAWMIANGYPEHLARQNLPCTFTAASDEELSKNDKPS